MKNAFRISVNGLTTGLFLQLAIGPVFIYVVNVTLQRAIYDGLAAVLAVTLVDYFYISLSVLSIGKLLEKRKHRNISGIISSIILIIFGLLIIKGVLEKGLSPTIHVNSDNIITSFISALVLTISNPLTIVFFSGIFTSKAIEKNYNRKELGIFGLATGSATFLFLGLTVILISFLKQGMSVILVCILNLIAGIVITGYGIMRIFKINFVINSANRV